MSTPLMTLVIGFARSWVRLYTTGLPSEVKHARRAEIESDLWEHERDASALGSRPDETALQVFIRLLLGIAADLSWRLEQVGAGKVHKGIIERRGNVNASTAHKGFIGVAALLAVVYVAFGLMILAGGGEDVDNGWGLVGLAAGAAIVAGLWTERRSPLLGTSLVAVGAIPLAVLFWWSIFTPILAVLLVVLWIIWTRGTTGERSSES